MYKYHAHYRRPFSKRTACKIAPISTGDFSAPIYAQGARGVCPDCLNSEEYQEDKVSFEIGFDCSHLAWEEHYKASFPDRPPHEF